MGGHLQEDSSLGLDPTEQLEQRRAPELDVYMATFRLASWWLSAFTDVQRRHIRATAGANPWSWSWSFGPDDESVSSRVASDFLCELATLFRATEDRKVVRLLFGKAEEIAASDPLDLHYTYTQMIRFYYRDREEDAATLDAAIAACEKQIALAPRAAAAFRATFPGEPLVGHPGFEQLAIIREKQGHYAEAIALCRQALGQGWAGDWEWRAARCETKARATAASGV